MAHMNAAYLHFEYGFRGETFLLRGQSSLSRVLALERWGSGEGAGR